MSFSPNANNYVVFRDYWDAPRRPHSAARTTAAEQKSAQRAAPDNRWAPVSQRPLTANGRKGRLFGFGRGGKNKNAVAPAGTPSRSPPTNPNAPRGGGFGGGGSGGEYSTSNPESLSPVARDFAGANAARLRAAAAARGGTGMADVFGGGGGAAAAPAAVPGMSGGRRPGRRFEVGGGGGDIGAGAMHAVPPSYRRVLYTGPHTTPFAW